MIVINFFYSYIYICAIIYNRRNDNLIALLSSILDSHRCTYAITAAPTLGKSMFIKSVICGQFISRNGTRVTLHARSNEISACYWY